MLRKSVTQQYPEVKPALPPRSRGVIALVEENCTSCMLCARECPDWCIYIDSHKETVPAPEGGRPRQRNVLDRFAIDFALCMYCGICIEVCPFDALFWSPEFEYAEGDIRNLLHEKDRLSAWTQTVPPPPPHDPGAEPPKELTAAPRRPAPSPRPAASQQPAATQEPSAVEPSTPGPGSGTAPGRGQEAEAGTTGRPQRPRRAVSNVRGIRPPGALPAGDTTPPTRPDDESAATPPSSGPSPTSDATPETVEKLSTGSGETESKPDPQGQTAAPSPRRRRMADPRSIRPPGRLGPDEPKEPEEES
ncbi:NuoI/complex I 23 kDa subunit family protein [Nonomuraea coxensis]|nr:NADH-quinone oxidoreductase subunit I [Nonomuraea coxensis]